MLASKAEWWILHSEMGVADFRGTSDFPVGDDVGRVQQLRVAKGADGAAIRVGVRDARPERRLVQASARDRFGVGGFERGCR
jgi:hypothetical protein